MSAPTFTAAVIATALGKTKRTVQLALAKTKPDNLKIVRGQQADSWLRSSLPVRYVQELDVIAERRGYRHAEHLLSDPPRRFVPVDKNGKAVPIGEIAEVQLQRAAQRQKALALSLSLRDRLRESDSKQLALAAFRGVLGNACEETWNRWLKRVIQRDAGEERFDDLQLYFEDVISRKPEARERIAIGSTAAERILLDALTEPKDLTRLTLTDKAKIWEAVAHFIDDAIAQGEKSKRAMHRAFALISGSRVSLASSDYRLRRNIKEKFLGWIEGGRTFAALEDKRPANSGLPRAEMLDVDRHKVIGHAVKNCGGRISQAFRYLRNHSELSVDLTSRFISNPESKSYVPKSIRRAVTLDVRRLYNYHHGEREHRLRGAYHTREWNTAAGDFFQSDDLTAPVYFWKQGFDGIELTRGQFLPMIDERTGMILGFVLIQEKNYNSLSIRSLITNVCAEHGLPRRGFAFERGIWKSSKILTGQSGADLDEIADTGLRRLGMQIRHAILPRAKVIERSLGQLQNLMEGLTGYCGRNEQVEKFERFQRAKLDVEAGRADPREHFFSAEEARNRFAEICDIYNNEPQQGRRLQGLAPVEGWEQLQGAEPRIRFDPRIHYFLASDLRRLKVGRNGLTIQVGKKRFNYKGKETGERIGESVFAWFNQDIPDLLTCTTDFDGTGIFTVERSYELPAAGASRELWAEENRKIDDHNRPARDLYHIVTNNLPPAAFRYAGGPTVGRLGDAMAAQQSGKRKQRAETSQLADRRRRVAQAGGINPGIIRLDPGAIESAEKLNAIRARVQKRLAEEPK